MSSKDSHSHSDEIKFIDLAAQQQRILPQINKAINTVLTHGKYILGPEVAELETKLAEFVGVKHCIGVSSGTDALLMALMARGIGPGDVVFTTPFTFIATAEVISLLGATPVFVDIDPNTFNIDPLQLEKAILALKENNHAIYPLPTVAGDQSTLTPKAIIPVDLFGLPADYDAIMRIAEENDLFILEDAAQGLGGVYKGRQAGSLGHAAAVSFFPAKPLGCYGDGGAVLTNDDKIANLIRSIRVHGKGTNKYDNVRIGLNARLHTMQAAILLQKLKIFPEEIEARQKVARLYTDSLSQFDKLTTPSVPEGYSSVWAQYSILSSNREAIQDSLKQQNIPTAIYYACPLHLQPAYAMLGYHKGDMPVTEDIAQKIFSLPMHPYLTSKNIETIVDTLVLASKD